MRLLLSCGLALVSLGSAQVVRADELITYTYSGTVSRGADVFGRFGAAGADLTGESVTVVEKTYVEDQFINFEPNYDYYIEYGPASSATVTIGGSSVSFDGYGYYDSQQASYNVNAVDGYNYPVISAADFEGVGSFIASPETPYLFTTSINEGQLSASGYYEYDPDGTKDLSSAREHLYYDIDSFQISGTPAVSAVPLPGSASMFGAALVALGTAGYGLKRQGKASA